MIQYACEWCGRSAPHDFVPDTPRIYCSLECEQAAYLNNVEQQEAVGNKNVRAADSVNGFIKVLRVLENLLDDQGKTIE